jgi:hypothetical protein
VREPAALLISCRPDRSKRRICRNFGRSCRVDLRDTKISSYFAFAKLRQAVATFGPAYDEKCGRDVSVLRADGDLVQTDTPLAKTAI